MDSVLLSGSRPTNPWLPLLGLLVSGSQRANPPKLAFPAARLRQDAGHGMPAPSGITHDNFETLTKA